MTKQYGLLIKYKDSTKPVLYTMPVTGVTVTSDRLYLIMESGNMLLLANIVESYQPIEIISSPVTSVTHSL